MSRFRQQICFLFLCWANNPSGSEAELRAAETEENKPLPFVYKTVTELNWTELQNPCYTGIKMHADSRHIMYSMPHWRTEL